MPINVYKYTSNTNLMSLIFLFLSFDRSKSNYTKLKWEHNQMEKWLIHLKIIPAVLNVLFLFLLFAIVILHK